MIIAKLNPTMSDALQIMDGVVVLNPTLSEELTAKALNFAGKYLADQASQQSPRARTGPQVQVPILFEVD